MIEILQSYISKDCTSAFSDLMRNQSKLRLKRTVEMGINPRYLKVIRYVVRFYEFEYYDWEGNNRIVGEEGLREMYGQQIFLSHSFVGVKKSGCSVLMVNDKEGVVFFF